MQSFIFILLLTLLFIFIAYTGYNSCKRELTTMTYYDNPLQMHHTIPKYINIYNNIEDVKDQLKKDEYVHSIWIFSKSKKEIVTRNYGYKFPDSYVSIFKNYFLYFSF